MATISITSLPYTFTSTGTQDDTLVFVGKEDKILTLFLKVTTAGTIGVSVGSAVGASNPLWSSTDTFLPVIFGGEYGEVHLKASAGSVTAYISAS